MPLQHPVIPYVKTTINGIIARPDSRSVMKKAIAGHPIEVHASNDYINLYHVFERLKAGDKSLSELMLVRKQVGRSRWLIFVTRERDRVPDTSLDQDYDPKRGRYKRYAERLAAGETVRLENRAEAIKARRAWQLYVPSVKRRHLRSHVTKVARTAKYEVEILVRSTGAPG